jgi:hypothetical protein
MNTDGCPAKIQNTMDPDWLQQNHPNTCITSQQHSSTTFILLHFHTHKEKSSMHLKNVVSIALSLFLLIKIV